MSFLLGFIHEIFSYIVSNIIFELLWPFLAAILIYWLGAAVLFKGFPISNICGLSVNIPAALIAVLILIASLSMSIWKRR